MFDPAVVFFVSWVAKAFYENASRSLWDLPICSSRLPSVWYAKLQGKPIFKLPLFWNKSRHAANTKKYSNSELLFLRYRWEIVKVLKNYIGGFSKIEPIVSYNIFREYSLIGRVLTCRVGLCQFKSDCSQSLCGNA